MVLPVVSTLRAALNFFWEKRRQFLILSFPIVLILSVLDLIAGNSPLSEINIFNRLAGDASNSVTLITSLDQITLNQISNILSGIVATLVIPLYAVAWHRLYLVPNEAFFVRTGFRWRLRHWNFSIAMLTPTIFMIPAIIFLGFLAISFGAKSNKYGLVFLPMSILFLYITARFSLWLPASAVDFKLSIRDAWKITRGNGFTIVSLFIVTGLVLAILQTIAAVSVEFVSVGLNVFGDYARGLIINIVSLFIFYAGTAVAITTLSISYQILRDYHMRE